MREGKNNILYFGVIGASVLILVIVIAVSLFSGSRHSAVLANQEAEIVSLKNQVETQKAQVQAGVGTVVQQTTGIDLERKTKDDAIIKEFAERVTTWSSHEEYTAMRADVMERYSLSEASRFASVFLPNFGSITDGDGVEHNLIDYSKISCSYRGMKSIVSGISGAQYSYFVLVTCAGGRDGEVGSFNVILCCSVDGTGNISNLEGYTLT